MIKEKEIEINGHSSNYKYYRSLGYDVHVRKPFKIDPLHLMRGSFIKITSVCDNCSKESKNAFKDYWNYTNGLVDPFYCKKCNHIKSEKTCLEKWGVKNPMQSDEVKLTLKKSLVSKYGVDWYSKSSEWKEKFKTTSQNNWGVDNPSKSDIIIDRIRKSNNSKYGVDWPMQSKEIMDKSVSTSQEKWGVDRYSERSEWFDDIKRISQEKWGVDNYYQTDECKKKVFDSNQERWGGHPMKNGHIKQKSKVSKERKTYIRYAELIGDSYQFLEYGDEVFSLVHRECKGEFKIQKGLLSSRFRLKNTICVLCNPIGVQFSEFESDIAKFLESHNIRIERKNKTILGGLEIDIYLPDYKIGIEANGVYWHSEFFKSSDYHSKKTKIATEAGIGLIHIWEDDWKNRADIIKSIILNRIGLSTNKIYARLCDVREVNSKEYRKFLDKNHVQGYSSASIKVGLYYCGNLISVMSFGWRRTNNKREFELIRFCNILSTNVVGGASKLFSFFLKNFQFDNIVSYADVSFFSGNLYKSLGFEKVGISDPNYFWVVDGIRRHRYNFSKRKLVKLGYDPNQTEVEIMHGRGYYRVYSTGQERWSYTKSLHILF